MNEMHLALTFDRNYLTPAYVMLTSVFENNPHRIHFHIIAPNLTLTDKTDLTTYINSRKAMVTFYEIDLLELEKKVVIPEGFHFNIANYYRLHFPDLVKVNRLLYLDVDLVVIGDLMELYATNLQGFPFGAVPDSYPVVRHDLGIHEEGKYFNTGVLLFDVPKWRQQNITARCFEFIRLYPEKIQMVEQDALNAIMIGNWLSLPLKYNITLHDVSIQIPTKEFIKDKIIIHFTSHWKPWLCLSRNKLRKLYHHYLKLSPRKHEGKYTNFRWDFKTLKPFIKMRAKEIYFDRKIDKIFPIKSWKAIRHYNY